MSKIPITLPTRGNDGAKRDPLVEFHERRGKEQEELRKQEARKRRQQLREHDEEKSLSSGTSFFDYLARSGAADDLVADDGKSLEGGGGKMKRMGSGGSTHSVASLLGLVVDRGERSAAVASGQPDGTNKVEGRAVKQAKSGKGNKACKRAEEAAQNGDWKRAVAYYHLALGKQRDHYGEDHLITSNTLNALGLALMNLGEHFGALTALEEALHIRQELLGAGSEEAAETTGNILLVLKASQEET